MYASDSSEIAFISSGCAINQIEFLTTRAEAEPLPGEGNCRASPLLPSDASGPSSSPAEPASAISSTVTCGHWPCAHKRRLAPAARVYSAHTDGLALDAVHNAPSRHLAPGGDRVGHPGRLQGR